MINRRKTSEFGKLVKNGLIQRNLTQHDLALLLGISDSYLCDILKGDRKGKDYVDRICILLDLDKIEKVS